MAGLYRRGKIYWCRAQRQGREHRRSLQTADRAIAQKRLRQWLDELDATAWGDKPRRSYVEAEERFIREHLTTLKPKAARRYGVSLVHLSEHFAGKMIDAANSSAELSTFETKRRSQGVTASTVRRDLACLSSMVTSCVDWEWLDENKVPAFLRRRSKRGLKEGQPRTRYFTEAEEAVLLGHASDECRQAIILSVETGLRLDELFGLKWSQIDRDRGVIDTTRRTKSGRPRPVPLSQRAARILAQLPRYLDSPYVLVNPETRTRYVQMEKGFKAAARRGGIKDARWHDLRRTSGCRWLQRDRKSMEEVSGLLGHSSVTVTEKCYAFLDLEQVAQSLGGHTLLGTGTAD
jgi:integrase